MEEINGATLILPEDGEAGFGPSETSDAYVVQLGGMPPGAEGPPLHIHPHTDEAFFVMEGEMTFVLGEREVPAPPGTFVFVPRGVVHTARNDGSTAVRGMIVLSPGDAEHLTEPVGAP